MNENNSKLYSSGPDSTTCFVVLLRIETVFSGLCFRNISRGVALVQDNSVAENARKIFFLKESTLTEIVSSLPTTRAIFSTRRFTVSMTAS